MASASDHQNMSRAIELARKGRYTTRPNPSVGCVIVQGDQVVGEGYHERAGEPHAEVHALAMAGSQAKGATAYVTLEPCSHFGRTPPCAEALIKAGVAEVVVGMQDPNPQVAGRGIRMLEEKGVVTRVGVMEAEVRTLNPGFIKRMQTGRPYVRAKLAMSLDGRTAMASGESQWITGPQARSEVQSLRALSGAIVTGVGSILHDNSSLTLRENELNLPEAEALVQNQPLRVVLDSSLRTPVDAKVITGPGQVMIFCSVQADKARKRALEEAGAEVLMLDSHDGRINLEQMLEILITKDINDVLLETGATLAGAMMEQGLVDELVVFMAPVLMGSSARPLMDMPFATMAEKLNLNITDIRAVGNDWKITAFPNND
ncbi:hypothetical protein GZ77_21535 [Endozoicomonas montiporae]|uniref:Riboflavin biosynthesis protein RibD n=2 Tax=Endozoicomonas montiporae TaxID=1027273 RepID=A0A081N3I2_9GAMM|nr:bifunctional diaminohydroxyphosphoribosylaminopyrimidine deaminase/5-amino-6-(5-phosphoribosylamino)uracil reductase RibD [Endozoicomonas montiporae]AMO58313.1 riboflavin biosynthesis protein RibD [Endozoicomonas montiporae CL-33]KEQ13005.1 hypothetical protein GZ77_21535 [Endozoicomonas montiporae]